MLPGDTFHRECVHSYLGQPGVEALWSAWNARAVLGEKRIKEANLRGLVFDDPDLAIGGRASVREAGVTFEASVVENLDRLVHLEAGARIAFDVEPKVPGSRG